MIDFPKYRLRTFGPIVLESGGQAVSGLAGQRKRLALLALLAAAGDRGMARDTIFVLLWPESDEPRARNTLNQTIHVLRRELGDIIVSTSLHLALNRDVVETDVGEFRDSLERGEFARAAGLYRGPFLDGLYLREAPEFERWLETERADLATAYAGALERLASAAAAGGDRDGCVHWWRMRTIAEPLSSRVALAYMRALVAAGEREAALQHARVYRALLDAEFGAAPDVEIERYLREITKAGEIGSRLSPDATPSLMASPLQELGPGRSLLHSSSARLASTPMLSGGTRADQETSEAHASAPMMSDVLAGPPSSSAEKRYERTTQGGDPRQISRRTGSHALWSLAAVICAVVIAVVIAASRTTAHSSDGARVPIVLVAPFDAGSVDTTLGRVARVAEQVVVDAVAQSGVVGVVDAEMVTRDRLSGPGTTSAGRRGGSPLTIADLSARVGARLLVDTHLERKDDTLEFRSRVVEATTGAVVATLPSVRFASSDDPSSALHELTERVLGALAVAVDPQIARLRDRTAHSPRFDAYREYVDGLDAFVGRWNDEADYAGALTHFARAGAMDSTFNAPYVWMAFAYGFRVAPVENVSRAQIPGRDSVLSVLASRRDQLSPLETLALDYFRANASTGIARCRGAYTIARRGAELAPGSLWTYLVGYFGPCVGRLDEAVAAFQLLERSDSWLLRWAPYWLQYAHVLDLSGQQDSALAIARRGARHSTDMLAYLAIVRALGAKGDVQAIDGLLDSLSSVTPSILAMRFGPGRWLGFAAQEAAVHDHATAASEIAERCVEWYQRRPVGRDQPPQFRNIGILVEAGCASQLGQWKRADSLYRQLPADDEGALDGRAVIALREGDESRYRGIVAELHQRAAREPTTPWVEVDIAAARGQPREMVEKLRQAYVLMPGSWHSDPDIHRVLRNQPALRSLLPPSQ